MTVVSIDGGLATLGLTWLDLHAMRVLDVSSFASSPLYKHPDLPDLGDDRLRRARELATYLRRQVRQCRPSVLVVERMRFPKGHNTVVCIALGFGVIMSIASEFDLPVVTASARRWRRDLADSGTEVDAHGIALSLLADAYAFVKRVKPDMQPHVLDALGVGAWSRNAPTVRRVEGLS